VTSVHAFLLSGLLIVAIFANGLLAGLFFVFDVAISPALRRVDDVTYIRMFRGINRAILNGRFLTVFFVAPVAAVVCLVLHLVEGSGGALPLILGGAVCSVLTFGITAAGNVPLNQDLDGAPIDTEHQRRAVRQKFESRWNRWNLARTVTSAGALALLAIASVAG